MNKTNWLAIIAAAAAGMFVGFLWYGFIFQKQWMDGNAITVDESTMKMFKNGVEQVGASSPTPMIFNVVAMFLYALVLNWLLKLSNSNTLIGGVTVGAAIGFITLVGVHVNNMFAMRPHTLSMVDGSYSLVLFAVMGAILGAWQKK